MSLDNYSRQKPGRFIDALAVKKRRQMYDLFMQECSPNASDVILDVGVTADKEAMSSNFLEKYYPHKQKIIALSNQNASFLETLYPGLTYKKGDARQLPFLNNSVDFVFSSAVIEHVGALKHQQRMLAECHRVARKAIFITTPNRWHPIEAHTLLPFIHWLPKSSHRFLLRILGLNFHAAEENLNLLDKKTLHRFCHHLNILPYHIFQIMTLGITSNLILIAKK